MPAFQQGNYFAANIRTVDVTRESYSLHKYSIRCSISFPLHARACVHANKLHRHVMVTVEEQSRRLHRLADLECISHRF
jgi:hypothetical protein